MHLFIKDSFRRVVVPIMIIFSLIYIFALPALAQSVKELPRLVTLNELQMEPSEYHGHRIVVTGRVRSIEVQKGRRGGEYVMLVLEDENAGGAPSQFSIRVVSHTLPMIEQGHYALVQGTYYVEGKQAGRAFENFIHAEVILNENL